jgi:hypothetical protein
MLAIDPPILSRILKRYGIAGDIVNAIPIISAQSVEPSTGETRLKMIIVKQTVVPCRSLDASATPSELRDPDRE